MKTWIPIIFLTLAVTALCVWDGVNTNKVFNKMLKESDSISSIVTTSESLDEQTKKRILELNSYWTDEMDTLCISISRKDLQPVSDYLQYLCSAVVNDDIKDAVTYSTLLNYNLKGLKQVNGIEMLNLL